jgi:tetratricopeptide (TPR) repeat protein
MPEVIRKIKTYADKYSLGGKMLIAGKEVPLYANIIVGDEDIVIFRKCLESIRPYVDVILVGWNGIKWETESLLKDFKCEYFKTEWHGKFQEKRKEVWDKTPDNALVIWLDSDDVLLYGELLKDKCAEVFAFKEAIGIALNWYYSREHKNHDPKKDIIYTELWRERIVRKDAWQWIEYELHEALEKTREGECFTIDTMQIDHLATPEKILKSQQRNYDIISKIYDLEKTSNALRPKTLWDYARATEGIGKKKESIDLYKEYLKVAESDVEKCRCYGIMSEVFVQLDIMPDAVFFGMNQILTGPVQPDGYINVGGALFNQKRYKAAAVFLEMSFNFKPSKDLPKNPTRYDLVPMKLLAICYMLDSKLDKAKKCANYVLSRVENDEKMIEVVKHVEQVEKQLRLIDAILELKIEIESKNSRVKHLIKALPDWAFDHPTIAKWRETHKW